MHTPAPSLWRTTALALAAAACALLVTQARAELAADKQPLAWPAPLDFSTYNLAGGTAVAFRGDYIRSTWDGDLVAYNVSAAGVLSVKWRAREHVPAAASRIIFTSSTSGTGAAFQWSNLIAAQQTALGGATNGPLVLAYLRGDSSKEAGGSSPQFRNRFSTLGAIVHSRPYFNGSEVYVGANDGMLHAFDAANGNELFAYVPSMLFANGKLASSATTLDTDFPYLVDGSMTIGTVGSTKMLIGALGAGAKGLYALNITSPRPASEAVAKAMATWELTDASTSYGNLGNVMTAPLLVQLNTGVTAVLVPNGLNSTGKVSSLFVIKAADGSLLKEISAGTAFSDGTANALGGIAAVDVDGNGTVDVVYAGDLKGTLWKFDLSSKTGLPGAASALLTPTDARPITAAPSVSRHPRGGLMLNFGTGKAYTKADLSTNGTDYLYGVWDQGTVTSSDLVTQTLTTRTVGSTKVRTVSDNAVNYGGASPKKGWRMALDSGERVLGGSLLTDSGRFMVTTADPGTGTNGSAWLLQATALTGSAPSAPFFDLNGDGTIDADDNVTLGSGSTATRIVPVGRFLGDGVWSQPVLGRISAALDLPYFNHNTNETLATYTSETVTTPPPSGGVSNGHFDFDIFRSCNTSKAASKDDCTNVHKHEYDDLYNVVGVHMLSPSEPDFALTKAITSTTRFKVLVANTKWSPAAALKIGSTVAGTAWKLPVTTDGFLADTTGAAAVFTAATMVDFIYFLPLDAFTSKDWGTGVTRAGLVPTQTSCVRKNDTTNGVWMDGAFTIQVVAESTTASDVQSSGPADSGGYRLKDTAAARGKLLAQYTSFWHKDGTKCKTESGWNAAPAQDAATTGGSRPSGSKDPQGNFYSTVVNSGGGSDTTRFVYNGVTVLVTLTFDTNGVHLVLKNTSGTVVSDTWSRFGSTQTGVLQTGQQPRLGRMGWKEVVR
jgi:hypothetical protein